MTKKEIYSRVVQLTYELTQTKIPAKIFNSAMEGDVKKTDYYITIFPYVYPDLYQRIFAFGQEFNQLVGDSEENHRKFDNLMDDLSYVMYSVVQTGIIRSIVDSYKTASFEELSKMIADFAIKRSNVIHNLIAVQNEYYEYYNSLDSGHEGCIFGYEADDDKDVYVFNSNFIDALSFFVFTIFSNTLDYRFFIYHDTNTLGEVMYENDDFLDALEEATNMHFAWFVANYNFNELIGEDCQSPGELLVSALSGEFFSEEETSEESIG